MSSSALIEAFVTGSEQPEELRTKLRSSLDSWDKKHRKDEKCLYHYTKPEFAEKIAAGGFRASNVGMAGGGVYLTTLSPADPIERDGVAASWPSELWREHLLQANYGDDWRNPERQSSVNAVLVCFVHEDLLCSVEHRTEAWLVKSDFVDRIVVQGAILLFEEAPLSVALRPCFVLGSDAAAALKRHGVTTVSVLARKKQAEISRILCDSGLLPAGKAIRLRGAAFMQLRMQLEEPLAELLDAQGLFDQAPH